MAAIKDNYSCYVADRVLHRVLGGQGNHTGGERDEFRAAVVFADVSGSSALARRLNLEGPGGAERLAAILNEYFSIIIDGVHSDGGDIVKFAGDAVLAMWPVDAEIESGTRALERAVACIEGVIDRLSKLNRSSPHGLAIRFGLAVGDVEAVSLKSGAVATTVFGGFAVAQAAQVQAGAGPNNYRLAPGLEKPRLLQTRRRPGVFSAELPDTPIRKHAAEQIAVAYVQSQLRLHVPPIVANRIEANQHDWLTENRDITTLFVGLPNDILNRPEDFQSAFVEMTRVLAKRRGTLLSVRVDDKGPAALVGFGVPPSTTNDYALQAVLAAFDIEGVLPSLSVPVRLGVASGPTSCVEIGNPHRREYTLIGDAVNRAAQMMSASSGGLACDANTKFLTEGRLTFERHDELRLNGVKEPIERYFPRGVVSDHRNSRNFWGRETEIETLKATLDEFCENENGSTLIVNGDAGMGKSALLDQILLACRERCIYTLTTRGEFVQSRVPFHPWRRIVRELLGFNAEDELRGVDADTLYERIASLAPSLSGDDINRVLPLLSPVLGVILAESDSLQAMNEDARTENLIALLTTLLSKFASTRPLALVIDDAHWLDTVSWRLIRAVAENVQRIVIVVAQREFESSPSGEQLYSGDRERLVDQLATHRIDLEGLSGHAFEQLVTSSLGVERVPRFLLEAIAEPAQGKPFFCEEICRKLLNEEKIVKIGAECQLAPDVTISDLRQLPPSVEAMVLSRVDNLPSEVQLAIRLASVFGNEIDVELFRDFYPIESERDHVMEYLEALRSNGFLDVKTVSGKRVYSFRHALIAETVRPTASVDLLRKLHLAIAEHYEAMNTTDAPVSAQLLARHWRYAVDPEGSEPRLVRQAAIRLGEAGLEAHRVLASPEAIEALTKAVELNDTLRSRKQDVSNRLRARWEHRLGSSHFNLGACDAAHRCLRTSLKSYGERVPTSAVEGVPRLAVQYLLQKSRRRTRRKSASDHVHLRGVDRNLSAEKARVYEELALVALIRTDLIGSTYGHFRSLNIAETAGPSPELAVALCMVGLIEGIRQQSDLAQEYMSEGFRIAELLGDEHTLGRAFYTRGYYGIGEGDWTGSDRDLQAAVERFSGLNDFRWRDMSILTLGNQRLMQSKTRESTVYYDQARESSMARGDFQAHAWSLMGLAAGEMIKGNHRAVLQRLDAVDQCVVNDYRRVSDPPGEMGVLGMRALVHGRLGNWQESKAASKRALELVQKGPYHIFYAALGYTSLAELALELVPKASSLMSPKDLRYWRKVARIATHRLAKFSGSFPMARPQSFISLGNYAWYRGRRDTAKKHWEAALQSAERIGLDYDAKLALFHLAYVVDDPQSLLESARETFESMGAKYYLELTLERLFKQ